MKIRKRVMVLIAMGVLLSLVILFGMQSLLKPLVVITGGVRTITAVMSLVVSSLLLYGIDYYSVVVCRRYDDEVTVFAGIVLVLLLLVCSIFIYVGLI